MGCADRVRCSATEVEEKEHRALIPGRRVVWIALEIHRSLPTGWDETCDSVVAG